MSAKKKSTSNRKKSPKKAEVIEGVAEEVTDETIEAAKEGVEDVKENVSEVADEAAEAVDTVSTEASELADDVADTVDDLADQNISEDIAGASDEVREEVIEEVVHVTHDGGRTGWLAAGAMACFIGGAGALAYASPWLSQNLPESLASYFRPAGGDVETKFTAIESAIGTLEENVSTLGNDVKASAGDQLGALTSQLDELQGQVSALSEQASGNDGVDEQIKALEAAVARNADAARAVDIKPVLARIEQIETALKSASEQGGGSAAALAAVSAQVAALGTEVKALEPRIDAVGQDTAKTAQEFTTKSLAPVAEKTEALAERIGALEADESGKAAARAIALAGLSSAVQRGNFSAELETFRNLAPDAMATPALDSLASVGVPGLLSLQSGYRDNIKMALKAESTPDENASWSDKLFGNAMNVVTVRPVGEVDGNSTSAILARGEVRLQSGDIPATLAELSGLTGPAKDAMAGWMKTAEARITALAELEKLKQSSLAAMSGITN